MKNIFIVIIVLAIVGGIMLFLGKGKEAEAPVQTGEISSVDTVDTSEETDVPLEPPVSPDSTTQAGSETAVTTVKEFVVTGQNFSFTPSVITVQQGDRVKITFKNTSGFHDFVIDEYGVATKQTQSPTTEILEFTANKIGSFEYYCSVGTHRAMGMKGILVVN